MPIRASRTSATRPRRGFTSPRRGVALIIALMATVLIGALVAGAVYTSTQEFRIGRYATSEPRATGVAEMGLNMAAAELVATSRPMGTNGDTATIPVAGMPQPNGDQAVVMLTRLTGNTYLLTSTGTAGLTAAGDSTAARTTRRSQLLIRNKVAQINFLAALTSNGPTKIGGSSEISGNDSKPASWTAAECPSALAPAKPALVTNDSANITVSGTKVKLTGSTPLIKEDPAAADTSTYFKFGQDADWASMRALADIRLPAGADVRPLPLPTVFVTTTKCETKDSFGVTIPTNWGEPRILTPRHPCVDYLPVIYADDDLKLTGGRGQGILMVNGDLEVAGGFEFYGPVIVRGNLRTTGTGGHFNGGVMAANVDLDQNVVLGDAVITFSTCAITRAVNGAGSMQRVASRPWASMY